MKYDYVCKVCRAKFEIEFPIDAPVYRGRHLGARCVVCGSSYVRKTISKTNIRFKGSGFYATDNRSSSETNKDK